MKLIKIAAVLSLITIAAQSHPLPPSKYSVSMELATDRVTIDAISIKTIATTDNKGISRINAVLKKTTQQFIEESKDCSTYGEGNLWGYRVSVAKVLLSKKYLTVVFDKFSVCSGSPNIEKEARVFSAATGEHIPPQALISIAVPTAQLNPHDPISVHLSDDLVNMMIKDSKSALKSYDMRCDNYLHEASYRIWVDDQNLILFPEFLQILSHCQREYLIRLPR